MHIWINIFLRALVFYNVKTGTDREIPARVCFRQHSLNEVEHTSKNLLRKNLIYLNNHCHSIIDICLKVHFKI